MTILVNCTTPSAQEASFLAVLEELLKEFDHFPGTDGHGIFQNSGGVNVDFSILQRFTGESAHKAWLASPAFARWRKAVAPSVPTPGHVRRYSGMDAFFVSSRAPDAPPRWKMALLLVAAVYPLSFAISEWGSPFLARSPAWLGALATSVIMTVLMTYFLIPGLTRLFQGWLTPVEDNQK